MKARATLLAGAVVVCAYAATARASVTEGKLATREGKRVVDVPLEHTEVAIRATGYLAQVTVEQTFRNPYDRKIEAIYLFPLPTSAAVNEMEIETGGGVVKGEIHVREEAKRIYTRARRAGLVAALLTEERPNLFTQSVANIEPGAKVVVRLRYVQPLAYEDGGYELVFPMVAGPRYAPQSSAQAGDAAAVQPAVLPPDVRSSHDIGLSVEIDAGVPLRGVRSSSHQIVLETPSASAARVRLAPGDTIPNKDFILRYDVAGDRPEFAVLTHRAAGAEARGSFFLMMQPPADVAPAEVTPKELVFVIDTSSSMAGRPLAKAKEAVRRALQGMGPDDTFQIVRFSDAASALGASPIANKPRNVELALGWLDALEAGGGTEMTAGVAAALDFPHDPARLRIVCFLTDGYIGNEDEVLATVAAKLGPSRLFSFGVGTAVNRYLLEEMAALGRGALQVVRPDEDTTAAVDRFHARIARPVLTDVRIDWNGLDVADAVPAAVPDLFVGQPIVLSGHYGRPGAATITVRGMAAGREVAFQVPVTLPEAVEAPAVATVWARARIAELSRQEIRGATDATRGEITALALEHRLMSRYTAFVAVDTSRVTAGGEAETVAVPVEVPEGVRTDGTSGTGYGYGASGSVGYGAGYGSVSASYSMTYKMADEEPVQMAPVAKPKLVVGAATVTGDLSRSDYQHVVKQHQGQVQHCYEKALRTNPELEGRLVLELRISAEGEVTAAAIVDDDPDDPELRECVKAVARKWKFPAVPGGSAVVIRYPFVFKRPTP